jgi:hypothetical protein
MRNNGAYDVLCFGVGCTVHRLSTGCAGMADAAQEQLAALRKEEAEATASLLTELRKPEAQQSADIVSVLRERLAFLRQQILACISATATGAVLVCVKSKLCVCECVCVGAPWFCALCVRPTSYLFCIRAPSAYRFAFIVLCRICR